MNKILSLKNIGITIIVIAIVASGAFIYRASYQAENQRINELTTTFVESGDLQQLVFATGYVESDTARTVYSPATGTIIEIRKTAGTVVAQDEVILVIEEINVRGETVTRDITTPLAGAITNLTATVGQPIFTNQTPLFTIKDPEKLHIVTTISETDTPQVSVDQVVDVTFPALSNDVYRGRIASIGISSQSQIGTNPLYEVVVTIEEMPENLLLGMSADLEIITKQKNDVLYVDAVYLFEKDGETYARVIERDTVNPANSKITDTKVTTDFEGETDTEILTGLTEGQEIVLPSEEIAETRSGGFFGN